MQSRLETEHESLKDFFFMATFFFYGAIKVTLYGLSCNLKIVAHYSLQMSHCLTAITEGGIIPC